MIQYLILLILITCNSLLIWGQNKIIDSNEKYQETTILELYFGKGLNQIEIIEAAGGAGPSCFGIYKDKIYILDPVKKRILIYQNEKLINTIDKIDIYDFVLDKNEMLYGLSVNSMNIKTIDIYTNTLTLKKKCKILFDNNNLFNFNIINDDIVYFQQLYTKNNDVYIVNQDTIIKSKQSIADLQYCSIINVKRQYCNNDNDKKQDKLTLINKEGKRIEIEQKGKKISYEFLGRDKFSNLYFTSFIQYYNDQNKIIYESELVKYNENLELLLTFKKQISKVAFYISRDIVVDMDGNIFYMQANKDRIIIKKITNL